MVCAMRDYHERHLVINNSTGCLEKWVGLAWVDYRPTGHNAMFLSNVDILCI